MLTFILGLFAGSFVGIMTMGLLVANRLDESEPCQKCRKEV